MRRVSVAAVALLVLAGCVSPPERTVILIGLDGFRNDYLDRMEPPNLARLAREGVRATDGMIPVLPSKTFSNFFSIATGLYPARHGVVANTMYDPDLDAWFRINDRSAVEDPAWWAGEPIWITAEKQGLTAANFFWVGSETTYGGRQSTHWKRFDASIAGEQRVDTVLAWLDFPKAVRPRLITLYFSETDNIGHRDGPEGAGTVEAVMRVDGYLGRLLDGLETRGIGEEIDVVVVSDHGMSQLSPDRVVVIEDYVDPTIGSIADWSPMLSWYTGSERRAEVEAAIDRMPHVTRLDSATLDSVFRYGGHTRIPPVIALADDGWTLMATREYAARRAPENDGGAHGYDPRLLSMRSLFVARGPSFKAGSTVASFTNVDIYPLIARILGLDPAPVDGNLGIVGSALKETP